RQRKAVADGSGSGRSGGAKKAASAKRGSAAKRSGGGAKKAMSAKRSGAKSASPAMRRTNAAPSRGQNRTPTTRPTPNPPKEEKTIENTAPRTMKQADAIDLLTDDHLEVSALFKKYEKLPKKDAPTEGRSA